MKFQTICNLFPPIKVKKDRSSATVPDMSFTPREIISKFSRGERVPLGMQGLFDSDADDPQLDKFHDDPQIFEDDPTRDPTFDFGDYVEEKHALEQRQKAAKLAQKKKRSLDSKREASVEEQSASDAMKRETTSVEGKDAPSAKSGG